MLTLRCICGDVHYASEEHIGRQIKCRRCKRIITVVRPGSTGLESRPVTPDVARSSPVAQGSSPSLRRAWARGVARQGAPRVPARPVVILAALTVLLLLLMVFVGGRPSGTVPTSPIISAAGGPPAGTSAQVLQSGRNGSVAPAAQSCSADAEPPGTSAELIPPMRGNAGSLTVQDGTSADAVVSLFDRAAQRTVRRIYVRAGEAGLFVKVPEGVYAIRFAFGTGYKESRGSFCQVQGASEFDEPVDFSIRVDADGTVYTHEFTATLHEVIDGNARTHAIPVDEVFSGPTF